IEERLCAIEKILGIDDSNDRHARVKLEWSKVKDAGTHELWRAPSGTTRFHKCADTPVLWCYGSDYEIRPIAKKKKLIDKSKLPIGTMTNFGRLVGWSVGVAGAHCYEGGTFRSVDERSIRILPMTEWLHWQGGECPVPDGLIVWVALRDGKVEKVRSSKKGFAVECDWLHCSDTQKMSEVIAYRIDQLEMGYTDDESEAA
ncbi:MAG: hypothetical protein ACRDAM_14100, partial [Casimicrobium sp.]